MIEVSDRLRQLDVADADSPHTLDQIPELDTVQALPVVCNASLDVLHDITRTSGEPQPSASETVVT